MELHQIDNLLFVPRCLIFEINSNLVLKILSMINFSLNETMRVLVIQEAF